MRRLWFVLRGALDLSFSSLFLAFAGLLYRAADMVGPGVWVSLDATFPPVGVVIPPARLGVFFLFVAFLLCYEMVCSWFSLVRLKARSRRISRRGGL